MKHLHIDIETFSPFSIWDGLYNYALLGRVMLCAWAIGDDDVQIWDLTDPSQEFPQELRIALEDPTCICHAHNAGFERLFIRLHLGIDVSLERWSCTAARALYNGLPRSLKDVGKVLGLPQDKVKDDTGKALVNRFSKPYKINPLIIYDRRTHPEEWAQFIEYCRQDVVAERAIDKLISDLSPKEKEIWKLDQEINEYGFPIDYDLVLSARKLAEPAVEKLDEEIAELTNGRVNSSRQVQEIIKYIDEVYHVKFEDLQAGTVRDALRLEGLHPELIRILENRQKASKSSVAKYNAVFKATSMDRRLRGAFKYYGASRTGRWSGQIFQPQNLPRPKSKNVDEAIVTIKDGTLTGDIQSILSDCIRGCISPSEGHKLIVADLSGIEARVAAWLVGDKAKLSYFEKGIDLYKEAFARAFNIRAEDVTPPQRAIGKVMELALGYAGGAKAFEGMVSNYDIDLDDLTKQIKKTSSGNAWAKGIKDVVWMKENYPQYTLSNVEHNVACEVVKRAFRNSNKKMVGLWKSLEYAFTDAVNLKSTMWKAHSPTHPQICVRYVDRCIHIKLPSDRILVYHNPSVEGHQLYYEGSSSEDDYKWEKISTYGGSLFENIVQATSRDILAQGMLNAREKGFRIVMHVHDEIVTEVLDDSPLTLADLCECMTSVPWTTGLPLAAEGYEAKRYRK